MSSDSVAGGWSSDDLSVAGGDDEGSVAPRAGGGPRVRGGGQREQSRCYILVVPDEPSAGGGEESGKHSRVAAAILGKIVVAALDSPTSAPLHDLLRKDAAKQVRCKAKIKGYLEYELEEAFQFNEEAFVKHPAASVSEVLQQVGDAIGGIRSRADPGLTPRAVMLRDVLEEWQGRKNVFQPVAIVSMDAKKADMVNDTETGIFHCVAVTAKLNRKRLLVANDPSKKRLRTMTQPLQESRQTVRELRWNGPKGAHAPWSSCIGWIAR